MKEIKATMSAKLPNSTMVLLSVSMKSLRLCEVPAIFITRRMRKARSAESEPLEVAYSSTTDTMLTTVSNLLNESFQYPFSPSATSLRSISATKSHVSTSLVTSRPLA